MHKCLSCNKNRTTQRQKGIWLCKNCAKNRFITEVLRSESYSLLTKKELIREVEA